MKPGRILTVVMMIGGLFVAALTQHGARRFQVAHAPAGAAVGSRAALGGMNSYALALLLGGLRGPLVMVLWAKSEGQKADRDLESIDTQIEWIRLLQPEFDTVHIFQMWNKAYNLSVQMVGLGNKYTTILDALEYGRNVLRERPDNINIINQYAQIYSQKFGSANPEKKYYTERVRKETLPHQTRQRAARGQQGFQPLEMDVMLDEKGNLLAEYALPQDGRTAELPHLTNFGPYPYGLSPFALAYNYAKRAQVILAEGRQRPLQLSDAVIDSRPGLELKNWAEEEWARARRREIEAFGKKVPAERPDMEPVTAEVAFHARPDGPQGAKAFEEMLFGYGQAARAARASLEEYERHLSQPKYVERRGMYESHQDLLRAIEAMATADRAYFAAAAAVGEARERLLDEARENYRKGMHEYQLTILRHYVDPAIASKAYPPNYTRANIHELADKDQYGEILARVNLELGTPDPASGPDFYDEDRREYEQYIGRAEARLRLLSGEAPADDAADDAASSGDPPADPR